MNEPRTIQTLERDLKRGSEDVLPSSVLDDIRSRGRVRRRTRLSAYAGGAAAGALAAGVLVGVVVDDRDGDDRDRVPAAGTDRPKQLSPLAERALREIPGAVRVSAWQVLLPAPPDGIAHDGEKVPADHIEAGPIDIGARSYTGVTAFKPSAFPAWLRDGVEYIEKNELGSEGGGYPVGSTDMGIIVDAGPQDLACMRPLPQWTDDEDEPRDPEPCFPAMLGQGGNGERTYAWGMGTDDFLEEGNDLELFSTDVYSSGWPQTVWIGGTDGTAVATVTLVTTDGTRVEATVAAGTLVPGETMFWGTVTGELAVAVTRDSDGEVLERHEVKPCSDPVDCEVR